MEFFDQNPISQVVQLISKKISLSACSVYEAIFCICARLDTFGGSRGEVGGIVERLKRLFETFL